MYTSYDLFIFSMKTIISFFLLLCVALNSIAQKHDNIWMLGFNGVAPHPDQGGISIDFSNDTLQVSEVEIPISFRSANAGICNADGELLFYTNGIHIIDASHQIMENGDSLSMIPFTLQTYEFGLNVLQAVIVLPAPGNDSLYYLFHEPVDHEPGGLNVFFPELSYSIVDMNGNYGLGTVISKSNLIIEDTLTAGKITASRHANGRDWWILVPKEQISETYVYTLLLTPDGVINMDKQDIDPSVSFGDGSVGNAIFSPDGSRYIRHDLYFDPWNDIDVYGFDRCTGTLTFLEHFELSDTSFLYGGAAISPDSRYLYSVTNQVLYQFDLWASNIEATKTVVGEYDGNMGVFFGTVFATPQLAPDGKIYITTVSDTVMHVINTPNQPGYSSHFTQHSVNLPNFNDKSIPNYPNYRLGPLDGSPCDTLGLDNHPLAGFAFFTENLTVTFSDNSNYRPEEWEWDFGDGGTGNERNPVHGYEEAGEYYVCLTVRNEIDGDTYCRWVEVDTAVVVSTFEGLEKGKVAVMPNPAQGQFFLQLDLPAVSGVSFSLRDVAGREVGQWELSGGQRHHTLDVSGVANGLYFWTITAEGTWLGSGKLIVVE